MALGRARGKEGGSVTDRRPGHPLVESGTPTAAGTQVDLSALTGLPLGSARLAVYPARVHEWARAGCNPPGPWRRRVELQRSSHGSHGSLLVRPPLDVAFRRSNPRRP